MKEERGERRMAVSREDCGRDEEGVYGGGGKGDCEVGGGWKSRGGGGECAGGKGAAQGGAGRLTLP